MEFITLRKFDNDVEATLALNLLKDSGIEAVLTDEHIIGIYPSLSSVGMGISLKIPPDQEQEALAILKRFEECKDQECNDDEEENFATLLNNDSIIALLQESGALLEGHFKLTSGRHSNRYIEKIRLIHHPEKVAVLCRELALRLRKYDPDIVVGPAMGGIVLAYEVAKILGKRFVFAQRKDGEMTIRSGFPIRKGETAIVIEDISTTGGSILEVNKALEKREIEVVAVGLLVDRSCGKLKLNMPLESLLQLDIPSWEPEECPMCAEGKPITTPGSSDKK